ncbi:MAG: hypothetical protein AB1668_01300 [Nanoarchaeota archaeon]
MKQKTIRTIALVIAFVLALQLTLALGIKPAKTVLQSEKDLNYSGSFFVVNNDKQELTLKLSVGGSMGEYVHLNTEELHFRDIDEEQTVSFEVNLPHKKIKDITPGVNYAEIVVEEVPEEEFANTVSSRLVLKHKIIIEGPKPDKYIKTKLNFHDEGEAISLVSEVENIGKLDIDSVQTTFYVNDKKQETHTLTTETIALKKNEDRLLRTSVNKDLFELGEFEVSAVTTYDGEQMEVVKKLLVGKPEVEATYFSEYFIANKINSYSMDLLNKWNKKINNVFVDVTMKKENQPVGQFRTKSTDIEGKTTKTIEDFLDARNKNPGKYSFDLVVNFWNNYRMETKTFTSELLTEKEYEEAEKSTQVRATQLPADSGFGSKFLILLIPNIIALGVAFYLIYLYKRKSGKDTDETNEKENSL